MLEAVDLASLRIDTRHHVFDCAVFAGGVHCLKNQEEGISIVRVEQTLQLAQFFDLASKEFAVIRLRFVERLRFPRTFAQAPARTREEAEFFQVHFHDVGNYLRLRLSEMAPEEGGDLRIPICVLKIRCAATGPVRAAIGNDTPWCNGNTAPFGGVIHGSNPCGVAPLATDIYQ